MPQKSIKVHQYSRKASTGWFLGILNWTCVYIHLLIVSFWFQKSLNSSILSSDILTNFEIEESDISGKISSIKLYFSLHKNITKEWILVINLNSSLSRNPKKYINSNSSRFTFFGVIYLHKSVNSFSSIPDFRIN